MGYQSKPNRRCLLGGTLSHLSSFSMYYLYLYTHTHINILFAYVKGVMKESKLIKKQNSFFKITISILSHQTQSIFILGEYFFFQDKTMSFPNIKTLLLLMEKNNLELREYAHVIFILNLLKSWNKIEQIIIS